MGLFSSLFGKKKQDEPPYPSWVNDSVKMEAFLSTLQAQVEQKNIPEKFLAGIMTNDYGRNKLLFTAGLMEQHGASVDVVSELNSGTTFILRFPTQHHDEEGRCTGTKY